jgi:two-component system response regulator GlrR
VPFEEARKTFERDYLVRLLKITGGVVDAIEYYQAGKLVRVEYDTLQRHRLDPAMFKEGKAS